MGEALLTLDTQLINTKPSVAPGMFLGDLELLFCRLKNASLKGICWSLCMKPGASADRISPSVSKFPEYSSGPGTCSIIHEGFTSL